MWWIARRNEEKGEQDKERGEAGGEAAAERDRGSVLDGLESKETKLKM